MLYRFILITLSISCWAYASSVPPTEPGLNHKEFEEIASYTRALREAHRDLKEVTKAIAKSYPNFDIEQKNNAYKIERSILQLSGKLLGAYYLKHIELVNYQKELDRYKSTLSKNDLFNQLLQEQALTQRKINRLTKDLEQSFKKFITNLDQTIENEMATNAQLMKVFDENYKHHMAKITAQQNQTQELKAVKEKLEQSQQTIAQEQKYLEQKKTEFQEQQKAFTLDSKNNNYLRLGLNSCAIGCAMIASYFHNQLSFIAGSITVAVAYLSYQKKLEIDKQRSTIEATQQNLEQHQAIQNQKIQKLADFAKELEAKRELVDQSIREDIFTLPPEAPTLLQGTDLVLEGFNEKTKLNLDGAKFFALINQLNQELSCETIFIEVETPPVFAPKHQKKPSLK